ncbi:MAG: ABC transporter ATP-binding protein [Acidobacteria bacterium]|nr:ABC transporter ATP-binding protein [Acidobacteriota bacterium]
MKPAIEVVDVRKTYRKYSRRRQFATLKSAILSGSMVGDLNPAETFNALNGVSFEVPAGSTFGIVGRNGSGKSTMLKLVAGITKPTSGRVTVAGRISALIELGAGFHPEISGRENVFINGIMLGLSKREITRRFDEIVEFAEMQDFIDAPVKTYSSGMYVRLGFAVAIHVDPDVLLVDEVLAVGDEAFSHKCLDKFAEFRRRGKTILLVTHQLTLVERFCDMALWLDEGRSRGIGDPRRVVAAYITDVDRQEEVQIAAADAKAQASVATAAEKGAGDSLGEKGLGDFFPETETAPAHEVATEGGHDISGPDAPDDGASEKESPEHAVGEPAGHPDMFQAGEGRWGSREAEITDVQLVGEEGQPAHVFQAGERVDIRIKLHAAHPLTDFVVGIGLFNMDGVCCFGTNTDHEKFEAEGLEGEAEINFRIDGLDLVAGTYKLDVALHRHDGYPYDYHRLLYSFHVKSRVQDVGIYRPRHTWSFSGGVRFNPPVTNDTQEP